MNDVLEYQIMAELGLDKNISDFAGLRCKQVRDEAVRRLPDVINRYHIAGELVALKPEFIKAVKNVRKAEPSETDLTITYLACMYAIRAHMPPPEGLNETGHAERLVTFLRGIEKLLPREAQDRLHKQRSRRS